MFAKFVIDHHFARTMKAYKLCLAAQAATTITAAAAATAWAYSYYWSLDLACTAAAAWANLHLGPALTTVAWTHLQPCLLPLLKKEQEQ
ncbi:hypothetical protein chiPu_0005677 [Chiloscyllium punctatum]|uniref:Uncharacterized protein n=1 Tax=Chiloscyllium punctatum TaxID=137246 RepID=A0A401SA48_CHIPU|nr:hypothetical protein [Chiloscyllium punctatum]